MLGVRRVGVTRAATALQRRALIRYRRGDISVVDVRGLERAACVCYAIDKKLYTRILGSKGGQQGSQNPAAAAAASLAAGIASSIEF